MREVGKKFDHFHIVVNLILLSTLIQRSRFLHSPDFAEEIDCEIEDFYLLNDLISQGLARSEIALYTVPTLRSGMCSQRLCRWVQVHLLICENRTL